MGRAGAGGGGCDRSYRGHWSYGASRIDRSAGADGCDRSNGGDRSEWKPRVAGDGVPGGVFVCDELCFRGCCALAGDDLYVAAGNEPWEYTGCESAAMGCAVGARAGGGYGCAGAAGGAGTAGIAGVGWAAGRARSTGSAGSRRTGGGAGADRSYRAAGIVGTDGSAGCGRADRPVVPGDVFAGGELRAGRWGYVWWRRICFAGCEQSWAYSGSESGAVGFVRGGWSDGTGRACRRDGSAGCDRGSGAGGCGGSAGSGRGYGTAGASGGELYGELCFDDELCAE